MNALPWAVYDDKRELVGRLRYAYDAAEMVTTYTGGIVKFGRKTIYRNERARVLTFDERGDLATEWQRIAYDAPRKRNHAK